MPLPEQTTEFFGPWWRRIGGGGHPSSKRASAPPPSDATSRYSRYGPTAWCVVFWTASEGARERARGSVVTKENLSKEGTVARSRLVRTSVKSRRLHSQRQYRSRSKERLVPTKQSLPTSLAHSHTTTVKQNEDSTREGSKEESKPAAATKTEKGAQQQHSPIPKNKKS